MFRSASTFKIKLTTRYKVFPIVTTYCPTKVKTNNGNINNDLPKPYQTFGVDYTETASTPEPNLLDSVLL